jgi:hypothetical protein
MPLLTPFVYEIQVRKSRRMDATYSFIPGISPCAVQISVGIFKHCCYIVNRSAFDESPFWHTRKSFRPRGGGILASDRIIRQN